MKKNRRPYVIVRAEAVGVFAGVLESHDPATAVAVLTECRRLWYWCGAASLSGLAGKGTALPGECKVPCAVPRHTIQRVMEVVECTAAAEKSLRAIPEWRI